MMQEFSEDYVRFSITGMNLIQEKVIRYGKPGLRSTAGRPLGVLFGSLVWKTDFHNDFCSPLIHLPAVNPECQKRAVTTSSAVFVACPQGKIHYPSPHEKEFQIEPTSNGIAEYHGYKATGVYEQISVTFLQRFTT